MPAEEGIFSGLRILEFGAGAAGPIVTRYFAEQGAEVIRIESRRRPDFLRLLRFRRDDPDAMEKVSMFVLLNPDKRSVRLDLQKPEGLALAKRLVAWADVVVENFAPGAMERLGLDWETLREIQPGLVMLQSSLFGQTGPQRQYPGFGGQGSAIAGFNYLTGHPDAEAHGPYGTITDSLSPRFAAVVLAAALLERRRTGEAQHLDVSQIEAGVYALSEWVVSESATGSSACREGNRSACAAPHGVFPTAGEDRWIAVAVHDDDGWRRLRAVMGEPAWAREARFDGLAGRKAAEDELEGRIADWTRGEQAEALAARLQAAGVDAAPVQDCEDLLADPQLAARGHFQRLRHAFLGELPFERSGFRLSESPGGFDEPGPLLGQHDHDVFCGLLGLTETELQRLQDAGVIF